MPSVLTSFFRLPYQERKMLLEAVRTMYWCKIQLIVFSFKKMADKNVVSPNAVALNEDVARDVRKAVRRAEKAVFWGNKCLTSTFCARQMLNRRKIRSHAFLSVHKNKEDGFKAHAWLKSGNIQVVAAIKKFNNIYEF